MKISRILLLVALGICYGLIQPGRLTYAFGHATLYVFLPALLFEGAWNLPYRAIRRQWVAIAILAGPGVLLTALIVAVALATVRVPFGPALLTGAILSATDPIAVVAVFRRLRVPRTLATIVECEALFNDAVAVVLYRSVLIGLALGSAEAGPLLAVAARTLAGVGGGVAFGVTLAFVVARALRGRENAALQVGATILCAYGSYFAGDRLGLSGICAVIACGIALRYFERSWITLTIVRDVDRIWEIAALLANVLVFFLVGAAVQIGRLAGAPLFAIACIVAVGVARFAVSGLLLPGPYPREWLDVVRVAGMRGGLSLALALALPEWVPYRDTIIDATFAVSLATLVAGSLTLAAVARRVARPSS